jgi:hypothetical protein
MNFYEKYMKYRNKYLSLKYNLKGDSNILKSDSNILKGGSIISKNYYLHIRFSKTIEKKFKTVKDNLFQYEVIKPYFKLTDNGEIVKETMPAHITMSYGPKLEYDTDKEPSLYEIKNVKEIEKIYPNFLENFKNRIPNIKYITVSPFLRPEKIVIKVEIESVILLEMIKFFRKTILSYNETIKEWKDSYNSSKEDIKSKFPNIFKEEESFDEENPVGSLHITLITLKPDTPENIIIDIIKFAEFELSKVGINKGDNIKADRVDVKTPITKKFIDLYKYKNKSNSLI